MEKDTVVMDAKEPTILFENEQVLVLDKPAGLMVHPDGHSTEATIADWLLDRYPDLRTVGEPWEKEGGVIYRPGIVHRLDKETSGVLVVAKDQPTYLFLKRQFQDREVQKEYRAFVYGIIKQERLLIDKPIGRSARDFRLYTTGAGARGTLREAQTIVKKLLAAGKGDTAASMVALFPKTGRTHQLRVHLKSIHHPIIGDVRYAPNRPLLLGLTRMALHAFRLRLRLPQEKEPRVFEAPLPKEFVAAEEVLQRMAKER